MQMKTVGDTKMAGLSIFLRPGKWIAISPSNWSTFSEPHATHFILLILGDTKSKCGDEPHMAV